MWCLKASARLKKLNQQSEKATYRMAESICKQGMTYRMAENICRQHMCKGLIAKIYKEVYNSKKKPNNLISKEM